MQFKREMRVHPIKRSVAPVRPQSVLFLFLLEKKNKILSCDVKKQPALQPQTLSDFEEHLKGSAHCPGDRRPGQPSRCHHDVTNTQATPASWPRRSSWDASFAKCRWWWGWASERWTTTGRAGWCSRLSCENAPPDTAETERTVKTLRGDMKNIKVCWFSDPLVVLLLLDLLHLVQQLTHTQLQLSQFVFGCNFRVVVGMFSNLNFQMDSLQRHQNTAK